MAPKIDSMARTVSSMLSRIGCLGAMPSLLRSSVTKPILFLMALVGFPTAMALPCSSMRAGLEGHHSKQGLGQFGASGTLQAGDAQHLALAQLKTDVLEECVAGILHSQHHLAELLGRAQRREVVVQGAADHQEDHVRGGDITSCSRSSPAAPSFSTVILSAISKTSSSRCEMKMIAMPRLFSRLISSSSSPTSV